MLTFGFGSVKGGGSIKEIKPPTPIEKQKGSIPPPAPPTMGTTVSTGE